MVSLLSFTIINCNHSFDNYSKCCLKMRGHGSKSSQIGFSAIPCERLLPHFDSSSSGCVVSVHNWLGDYPPRAADLN